METDGNSKMEGRDLPRNGALTPLRKLRGVICLSVLLLTAFMMLLYFGFVTAVIFRFFSIHYIRKITSFFFGAWLALWPFLFEKINKTKVVFSGDKVPAEERVLLIANHRTEVDWMYLWDLALRKGQIGYIKYILKSSLMKLPVFGWPFLIMEFIPVERWWEVDGLIMHRMLSTFKDRQDPLWLVVFPEGTDLLYDITIAHKHRCPSFMDNAFGVDPAEVHIHIRHIPINDIPTSEDETGSWLIERFSLKVHMLTDFNSRGHFPHEQKVTCLPGSG